MRVGLGLRMRIFDVVSGDRLAALVPGSMAAALLFPAWGLAGRIWDPVGLLVAAASLVVPIVPSASHQAPSVRAGAPVDSDLGHLIGRAIRAWSGADAPPLALAALSSRLVPLVAGRRTVPGARS